jgi:hypothetical protein
MYKEGHVELLVSKKDQRNTYFYGRYLERQRSTSKKGIHQEGQTITSKKGNAPRWTDLHL